MSVVAFTAPDQVISCLTGTVAVHLTWRQVAGQDQYRLAVGHASPVAEVYTYRPGRAAAEMCRRYVAEADAIESLVARDAKTKLAARVRETMLVSGALIPAVAA